MFTHAFGANKISKSLNALNILVLENEQKTSNKATY